MIHGWYQTNLLPPFEESSKTICELGKTGSLIPEFGYWWALYTKNSVVFFELMLVDKYSNQAAFTMRILMEISADSLYLSKHPEQIGKFRINYMRKPEIIKKCSYAKFVKLSNNYKMHDQKTGKIVTTADRIKYAFGKAGLEFYKYLCCYTHLNYIGVIKDIDESIEKNNEMDYRLEFATYFPETFTAMINAADKLSRVKNAFDHIDTQKIKTVINDMITRHVFGTIE